MQCQPIIDTRRLAAPDRIKLLTDGLYVKPFVDALEAHPELWNANPARTAPKESPHHGLSDIWCRFAPEGVDGSKPHLSVWWPAADKLPVRGLARYVMAMVGCEQLGGVLITRIPAHGICKPHSDPGWHARYYDKIAVQIAAAPGQEFHFEGQSLVTEPGDVFWFDNAYTHWVTNDSDQDRITAIFCMRLDRSGAA